MLLFSSCLTASCECSHVYVCVLWYMYVCCCICYVCCALSISKHVYSVLRFSIYSWKCCALRMYVCVHVYSVLCCCKTVVIHAHIHTHARSMHRYSYTNVHLDTPMCMYSYTMYTLTGALRCAPSKTAATAASFLIIFTAQRIPKLV